MSSIYAQLKEEAWLANLEIPARGLALYTWGNVSAFDPQAGVFAIKPSGVPYADLKVEDMVIVDLDGKTVEGTLNPSSDTQTHLVLYKDFAQAQNSTLRGIIHTHSPYAVSWSQARRSIPLFGTTHADHIQVAVPCTPYITKEALENDYERETGNLIVNHFKEYNLNPSEVSMVLVGGHGPFAWGKTAADAVYNGVVLEELAKMAMRTLQLNNGAMELPDYIVNKHYSRKHGPKAYYGQK